MKRRAALMMAGVVLLPAARATPEAMAAAIRSFTGGTPLREGRVCIEVATLVDLSGVRAEPFAWNAPQWVELELHLAWRARGMALETSAVRP